MAKERQETSGLTEEGLWAAVAEELVRRWKADRIHKGATGYDSGLSSVNIRDLLMAQKSGAITEEELRWLKRLRAELREEASKIIKDLLDKHKQVRPPTAEQEGKWIEKILLKFNNLIVS